ncbi:RHS repeat domain-containing protein [Pseudomonas sp. S2_E01]
MMTANLHHNTPTLAVYDPRSQAIRSVAYHRAQPDETPQSHITRQAYNASGHLVAGWDPRQWVTEGDPSSTNVHALSGGSLLSSSADAGWKAGMLGNANELRFEWDGRQLLRQVDYDDQLRPTTITEQVDGAPPVVSERMVYGEDGVEFASRNQCGRLIRHDDPAGSLHADAYDLRGSRVSESRHFTNDLSQPDWPVSLNERDQKLVADGETTIWQFDALGALLSLADARENRRLFAYDMAGQLLRINLKRDGLPDAPLLSDRRYSATGQIEHETAGNGVETTRRHDAQDGRLLQLTSARSGRTFQDLVYDYDPGGNISRIHDFVPATRYFKNQRTDAINHYRYDSLSQLVQASGRECIASADAMTAYTQTFSYDQAGNLLRLVHEGVQGYTRDMVIAPSSNRSLLKPQAGEADFINSFDENGNLRVLAPGAQAMLWDCRNQLSKVIQVIRNDEQNDDELYRYDAGGQRLRKVLQRKTKTATATREVRYLPGLEIHDTGNNEVHYVISVDTGNCIVRAVHWHQPPRKISPTIRSAIAWGTTLAPALWNWTKMQR